MAKIPGTRLETLDLPDNPPDDNDPCWCKGGDRFIDCHKDRHTQTPESKWATLKRVRQLNTAAYCSHPQASPLSCKGQVVRAHTLQKAGSLSAICVNRHIYGLKQGGMPNSDGTLPFEKIGINEASTFTGFCQLHDTELFRPLEMSPFTASKEQLFLLAYRALAKEVYSKRFALRMQPIHRQADKGKEPVEQVMLQRYLYLWGQQLQLSLKRFRSHTERLRKHLFFA